MYREMFNYVQHTLQTNNRDKHEHFHFRSRSEHIKRVYIWAQRITEDYQTVNKEALFIASIFHDVGYAQGKNNHAEQSALICEKYLIERNYNSDFIKFVCYLIKNHSNKKLMRDKSTPLELVLLMEADLLDETGALSIIWDAMAKGSSSFDETYHHILNYSYKQMLIEPMVTEKAKIYWKKKQLLTKEFMKHLSMDLMKEKRNLF